MPSLSQQGSRVQIRDNEDDVLLEIGPDGKLELAGNIPAANPDTSGAALAALETEVNEIKATLRAHGLIGP